MTENKIAIMQPYFFPYIGYFQLVNAVDEFVVYDNIEYTKKGWINRNRILLNGTDLTITLPLKKASDYLDIKDRFLADTWEIEQKKMLNRIIESYRNAPCFNSIFPIIEHCIRFNDNNLYNFIQNSIVEVSDFLSLKTKFIKSSEIALENGLKSQDKVLSICKNLNARTYINPIGGTELYNKLTFEENGIDLLFLKTIPNRYTQLNYEFISNLSIIDVLMFNQKSKVIDMLNLYYLE